MDICDECGFDFDELALDTIPERLHDRSRLVVATLLATSVGADLVTTRPDPTRWSSLEYGAHIRDVMLTIRDRIVIGLVEDNPGFKSLYREERIDLGLYQGDTAAAVAVELQASVAMLARLLKEIDPAALDRSVRYGAPNPRPRTLAWMSRQAVHELEHHHADMAQNAQLLTK